MQELNAKALRVHRGLRIMSAEWSLCVLRRLRPTLKRKETLNLFISVVY